MKKRTLFASSKGIKSGKSILKRYHFCGTTFKFNMMQCHAQDLQNVKIVSLVYVCLCILLLTSDAPSQLHVFGHDRHPFGVNSA